MLDFQMFITANDNKTFLNETWSKISNIMTIAQLQVSHKMLQTDNYILVMKQNIYIWNST